MTTNRVDQFIYGRVIKDNTPSNEYHVLAKSEGIEDSDVYTIRNLGAIEPLASTSPTASQSIAIVAYNNENFILVRTHNQCDDLNVPIYQYAFLPFEILDSAQGNLLPIVESVSEPLPSMTKANQTIAPLELHPVAPLSSSDQVAILDHVLHQTADSNFDFLINLVQGILAPDGLQIVGFPEMLTERIKLVMALMYLLPSSARSMVTFATNIPNNTTHQTLRLVFTEKQRKSRRTDLNWSTRKFSRLPKQSSSYIQYLKNEWDGNFTHLIDSIAQLDELAAELDWSKETENKINLVAERYLTDKALQAGKEIEIDRVIGVLKGGLVPPTGKIRTKYLEYVLEYAIEEWDQEAFTIVNDLLPENALKHDPFKTIFTDALDTAPDAVYEFARARLSQNFSEDWVDLLKRAAENALAVALVDADPEIVTDWLQLISREPAKYQLSDVLSRGIIAAQTRTEEDPELANKLIALSVRYNPALVDELLDNPGFVQSMPEQTREALVDLDHGAIETLASESGEIFLLALKRAENTSDTTSVNSNSVKALWEFYRTKTGANLPKQYRPLSLIRSLTTDRTNTLTSGALESLLVVSLGDKEDDLFIEICANLKSIDLLINGVLANAFQKSGREPGDVLTLLNRLRRDEIISSQRLTDILANLLNEWDWNDDTMPLIEQLARMLQQETELQVTGSTLWKLLDVAEENKLPSVAKVATNRLLIEFSDTVGEAQVVDNLRRLKEKILWNDNVRSIALKWWRSYVRQQSTNQLQKLEPLLENNRTLEPAHHVVLTTLAIRKAIGQRTLEDFANEMRVTLNLLEDLEDAFDVPQKLRGTIDQGTIRLELESRSEELPQDERPVLSKNLRELAKMITSMSDHRSKSSLMKRQEEFERELLEGKQQPQSAIDILKWLSGYLDGLQNSENTEQS